MLTGATSHASFSSLASGNGSSGWSSKTEGFKFSGTGSQLFQSPKVQEATVGDDEEVPSNNDIHFEPIIKLEEIDVKTGKLAIVRKFF